MSKPKPAQLWTENFWRAVTPETLTVGYHRAEPGWRSPDKSVVQTDFDMWYVAGGSGEVLTDGKWVAFAAGDLITLKPGSRYASEKAGADGFQVYFAHMLPFGRNDRGLNGVLAEAWPVRISLLHRPELVSLFDALLEAHATRPLHHSLSVRGLTLQLLDVVFGELRQIRARPPAERAHEEILQARSAIEASYATALTLDDIAKGCGLSTSHLRALFRRQFGVPPIEYLLRVRIREAKLLLARGERVKEVARRTGFSSQHYFCRQFRKRTGMTPSEFMLKHARRPGLRP